jgi:branched-chain amino acid transport system substrate-binding protein
MVLNLRASPGPDFLSVTPPQAEGVLRNLNKGGGENERKVSRRDSLKLTLALAIVCVCLGMPGFLFGQSVEEVTFGIIEPLSGPLASLGLQDKNGYQLAIENINNAGGIKSLGGAKLRMIIGDSESKPQVGMAQAERLIRAGVVALSGCFQSSVTFATTQVAEKNKVPHLINVGVADAITGRGFKYTFRVVEKASWNARDKFKYLDWVGKKTGLKAKTIGMLYEDTLFGQSVKKGWLKYGKKHGYKIVADLSYPHNTSDLTGTISKLKVKKPDVIVSANYTSDAILIAKTMKELNVNPIAFVAIGGGMQDPAFISSLGKDSTDFSVMSASGDDITIPSARKVGRQYEKRFNMGMSPVAALSYTTVYVLKDALERAGSTDREKLREALTQTNIGIGEKGIITPSPVEFGEDGQNKHSRCVVVQIRDGKRTAIYPTDISPSEPIWPMRPWGKK